MPTRLQVDTTVRFERERGVSEIAVARGIAHATVSWPESKFTAGRLQLLQALADGGVSLFFDEIASRWPVVRGTSRTRDKLPTDFRVYRLYVQIALGFGSGFDLCGRDA